MLLTPAQISKIKIVTFRLLFCFVSLFLFCFFVSFFFLSFFFFYQGQKYPLSCACLDAILLKTTVLLVPMLEASLVSTQTPNSGLRHTSFRRQVPESCVRSVVSTQTPSSGLRHPSFWRKVPESGARTVVPTLPAASLSGRV